MTKISNLIESQLPDFMREDNPLFVEFVKTYYQWLETNDRMRNLSSYQDIDTTTNDFIDHIGYEIAQLIPEETSADRNLLFKKITEIYRAKGSEDSFRMFFRALYNEEVELYYPEDNILKTSSGNWTEEKSIRLTNISNSNTNIFDAQIVTGANSNAKGRVQRISGSQEFGVNVTELFLSDIIGEFEDGERVSTSANTISGTIFNDTGGVQGLSIQYAGAGHQSGDAVNIISNSGRGANGVVSATTDKSLVRFELKDGGFGYTKNAEITIRRPFGQDSQFRIDSIKNTEVINVFTDTIGELRNVPLGSGPTFTSASANTSAVSSQLASANASSVLSASLGKTNLTVGTIESITTTNQGHGHLELPTVRVVEPLIAELNIPDGRGGIKGADAVIVANTVPGAIQAIQINEIGSAYSRFDPATIENITRGGTTNAIASVIVTGFVNYPGKYVDERGRPSSTDKLQDNDFYQKFSYVIRSSQPLEKYRKPINDNLHPAGTKLFGDTVIHITPEKTNISADREPLQLTYEIGDAVMHVPTIVMQEQTRYIANSAIKYIDFEVETFASLPTTQSAFDMSRFKRGTGTVSISADGNINSFKDDTINTHRNRQIQSLGNSRFVSGTGTSFTSNFNNGDDILLPDGLYTIETVNNNGGMLLKTPYQSAPLVNGSYQYKINT